MRQTSAEGLGAIPTRREPRSSRRASEHPALGDLIQRSCTMSLASRLVALTALVCLVAAAPARAQDTFGKDGAAAVKASFLADLDTLHTKFAALADAFPQDKYTW